VVTRFAVPFFVAACVFLVFQGVWRKPQRTFVQYGCNRFLRIYLPFLAWSAVYLGFKAVKSRFLPDQPNEYPTALEILWIGSFYHLWFMPFILMVSLAAFLVATIVQRRELLRWPVAISSLAAGLALSVPAVAGAITPNYPSCNFMVDALPAMFWAMTASLAYGCKSEPPGGDLYRFRLDVLLFVGSMIWLGAFGRSTLIENLAGTSLLLVALRPVEPPVLRRMAQFPALAYGIYFSHMLPIKVCEAFGKKLGFSESWRLDCAIFLGSAVAATVIAWMLYQSRWTRWLVA
jgi:surface polysaccharide O-acyltransferase-like enzyme